MTSPYDMPFDDIPLLVVPGTEDSEVIEYEYKMRQLREQIEKLKLENAYLEITVLCRQKLLPESTKHDWVRFCPRCGRDLYAEYPRGVELPKALKV